MLNATAAQITSNTRCAHCQIKGMDIAETTYFTVNGTNDTACLGHAVELEERNPATTFKVITPAVALYLTQG